MGLPGTAPLVPTSPPSKSLVELEMSTIPQNPLPTQAPVTPAGHTPSALNQRPLPSTPRAEMAQPQSPPSSIQSRPLPTPSPGSAHAPGTLPRGSSAPGASTLARRPLPNPTQAWGAGPARSGASTHSMGSDHNPMASRPLPQPQAKRAVPAVPAPRGQTTSSRGATSLLDEPWFYEDTSRGE